MLANEEPKAMPAARRDAKPRAEQAAIGTSAAAPAAPPAARPAATAATTPDPAGDRGGALGGLLARCVAQRRATAPPAATAGAGRSRAEIADDELPATVASSAPAPQTGEQEDVGGRVAGRRLLQRNGRNCGPRPGSAAAATPSNTILSRRRP